ncbi:nitric oxide synthase, brain-like [Anneissia japonica]|uniref:nitric oxide synthase, brain-like n=1 Tax=Anneissia japonica TaxID=1529436 RepID=UPI0014256D10|nr:nitric oxide synthase, brain-like [Anneissia japonica]
MHSPRVKKKDLISIDSAQLIKNKNHGYRKSSSTNPAQISKPRSKVNTSFNARLHVTTQVYRSTPGSRLVPQLIVGQSMKRRDLVQKTRNVSMNGEKNGTASPPAVTNGHGNLSPEAANGERSCPMMSMKSRTPSPQQKFIRIQNFSTGKQYVDTLHQKRETTASCSETRCLGSMMFPEKASTETRPKEEVLNHAVDFINEYYDHIKKRLTPLYESRIKEVKQSIESTGTYTLTEKELIFGAKLAWRNSARCIGRIQWTRLQVFDARNVSTASEMFQAIYSHIVYATNKGNLRATMTVFPPRKDGKDFRVWNPQFIGYAGYTQPDGSIIGDPANVEFTEVCMTLGWKGNGGYFDVLPLVLSANGGEPELFELPSSIVLQVEISHPSYDWFAALGIKWYALPAVSCLMLDIGGIQFPGAPFNGWYMGTEIGGRDLCDPQRYNMSEKIAQEMGLDTNSYSSLWKDRAVVEANFAVLYSFQKAGVTIADHHSMSDSFLKHMDNEQRLRGGCPADWVWIVPPISGGVTSVFHQEMLNYKLRPSFEYQADAWKVHSWKKNDGSPKPKIKGITFKKIAKAVKLSTAMMNSAMAKRIKVTILYATETGKSEYFADRLCEVFRYAFNPKIMCMDEYDFTDLENEALLLLVTSTFGNGNPPSNGESFYNILEELMLDEYRSLMNISMPKFAVFGLGSKAYVNFCAFAKDIDRMLINLGGERIFKVGEGDELSGQDVSFNTWARDVFKKSLEEFCLEDDENYKDAVKMLTTEGQQWNSDDWQSIGTNDIEPEITNGLSAIHRKSINMCKIISVENLQSEKSGRSTILVKMSTKGSNEMDYEPGDHVTIFPANEESLVNRIIARTDLQGISADAVIRLEKQETKTTLFGKVQSWKVCDRLPECSLRMALSRYLDITSTPTPDFIALLATFTDNKEDKKNLSTLADGTSLYEDWKFEHHPNMAEILEEYSSVRIPATLLMAELPVLKPRYYSISSSLRMFPGEIHLTVAVVTYKTREGKGAVHNGVCSTWLNCLKPGDEVPAFIKTAISFHIPANPSTPVVMIGPGTGIAPFRGFWQERTHYLKDKNNSDKLSANWNLYFGCRQSCMDHIYKEETQKAKNGLALAEVYVAYSREPDQPKTYVQDMLKKNSTKLYNHIMKDDGHLFVCGDVSMATGVNKAFLHI